MRSSVSDLQYKTSKEVHDGNVIKVEAWDELNEEVITSGTIIYSSGK